MTARGTTAARRRGWIAFAVPPAVWMGQLLLVYLLVPAACEEGRTPLLVVTAATLVAALAAIAVGRGVGGGPTEWGIARVARVQGWIFVFAIVAVGAAVVWIDPCA